MTSDVTDVVRALRERLAALDGNRTVAGAAGDHPARQVDGPATVDTGATTADDAGPTAADASGGPESMAAGADQTGAGLTEEERAEETRAKNICLRLLADSARPRANLEQKLTQRGISPAVIRRVLDRFTEVGLIDDQAYAEAYVRTKHQERALSRRALTSELRRKGVDDTVVAAAAGQLDADAEEIAATRLIGKRAPAALAAGPEAARRRLLALLDRRGYPADLSIRVVEEVLARRDE